MDNATRHDETRRTPETNGRRTDRLARAVRRSMGVVGWIVAGTAMTGVGSVQGVAGSWVAGFALYGILAREWADRPQHQRTLVHSHVVTTAVIGAAGAGLELWWLLGNGTGTIPWFHLPMVTITLGAMHNARHAPHLDAKRFWPSDAPDARKSR